MTDPIYTVVNIPAKSQEHAADMAAAMKRVCDMMLLVVQRNPQSWYGIGRAIADAEAATPDTNLAEVEFACYLAGLSVPRE